MKYDEFRELVTDLSSKYSVDFHYDDDFIRVFYQKNGTKVLVITINKWVMRGFWEGYSGNYENLPYSHKLYMYAAELSMTDIAERKSLSALKLKNGEYLVSYSVDTSYVIYSRNDLSHDLELRTSDLPFYGFNSKDLSILIRILVNILNLKLLISR